MQHDEEEGRGRNRRSFHEEQEGRSKKTCRRNHRQEQEGRRRRHRRKPRTSSEETSTSSSGDSSSQERRRPRKNPMLNWKAEFSGSEDLMAFLEKVEDLAEIHRVSEDELLTGIGCLLTGGAKA